jgi:hypothetical protein
MQPQQPTGGVTANGAVAGGPMLPSGAQRWSRTYFDGDDPKQKTAAMDVPVDQFAHVVGKPYKCAKCEPVLWFPASMKGIPVCTPHNRRMEPVPVKAAPLLPWRELWTAVERPLRPVWALPASAALGVIVDAGHVPALVPLAGVPVALAAGPRVCRSLARRWLGESSPEAAVAKAARELSYTAAAGFGWLALTAALDLPAHSWLANAAVWGGLVAAWLAPAATWWRRERQRRNAPKPEPVAMVAPERTPDELDAAAAAKTWRDDVAVEGTKLLTESWQRIPCGWQAVVVATKRGALNALGGDFNTATVRRIAAAYDAPFASVTWIEAFEDSPNKALLLVQPTNPLSEGQVWGGPATIDVNGGRLESGRLINGEVMWDTWYRYGWGAPSEIVLGSTGGGKSARARKKMIAERWTSHVVDGVRRGLFITLLHDPKRLESYAEFRDAIHGYGMTRDDAHILIDALLREMLRRYDYLSSLEWTDTKGRRRRGGVAWDPRVHGPVISHYWDEFHELAGDGEFVKKLEKLARYQRACAMRGTLLSHMGTLSDTGSQALRDMLAGGRATLFRTTSALNAGLVSGGQLSADPRTLPRSPGMCYVVDGETAPIMGRESYVPGEEQPGNVYDWLFDDRNQPIGFPAEIPPETAEAFGPEFMAWLEEGRSPLGRTGARPAVAREPVAPRSDVRSVDAVLAVLASQRRAMPMNDLAAELRTRGFNFATRTITGALSGLKTSGKAQEVNKCWELTADTRAEFDALEQERAAVAAEESAR